MVGEPILVVGGSGMLGAPVARALRETGYRVRILARNANLTGSDASAFEYYPGDVGDEGSLRRALEGCSGVHVSLRAGPDRESFERIEHEGTARVARLAAEAGVKRLTYLSGMYVGKADHEGSNLRGEAPLSDSAKAKAEGAIRASGVPYTVFRPTYFMETLARHIKGSRAVVLGRQPHPLHMIAAEDFARMVARAYAAPAAANRTFDIWGPEPITLADALAIYCRIVEPRVRVTIVPTPVMRVVDRLFMNGELGPTLDLMKVMQQVGEVGDPAPARQILGAPTTTLRAWCEAQARARTPA
jgi:uncharacterized protein YbjT (DUF2867 family)